jgi:hypothetical protein
MSEEKEEKKEEKKEEVSEREQILINFQKLQESQASTAPVEAEVKPEEKPAQEEKVSEEEKPPVEDKQEEKKSEEKEKFVPHAALHEERIKRQAADMARKAAEERARSLEEQMRKITPQNTVKDEEITISDYDRELIESKKRIQALEEIEKKRIEREEREFKEKIQEQFHENVRKADSELENEGYPGFSDMLGRITRELELMVKEDESNKYLDTPEGWKKIFKERVFPDHVKKFEQVIKKKSFDDKIALKTNASLATSSGKKISNNDDKKGELSDDEYKSAYLKMRGIG